MPDAWAWTVSIRRWSRTARQGAVNKSGHMCVATNRMDCASIRIDDAGASLRLGYAQPPADPGVTCATAPLRRPSRPSSSSTCLHSPRSTRPEAMAVIRSHEMTPAKHYRLTLAPPP